jgi:flagella synthesis protein FlgN
VASNSIDRLTRVLIQSEQAYRELLDLLQREKQAAMASDAQRLSGVVERKTDVVARLASLERQRNTQLQAIAGSMDIHGGALTLSHISRELPDQSKEQLDRLSASLRSLAVKTRRLNEENRALVAHCLHLVRGALGFFQQMLNPASVYGASGRVDKGSGSGRLLSGVV